MTPCLDPIGKARAWLNLGRKARRLGRDTAGIAAVEFALILPMMLVLYFGCAVLAQGLEAGRKTQLLSRALADLTSQVTTGTYSDGNCAANPNATPDPSSVPCVTDSDLMGIFGASTAVLYPFKGATTMTISEVVFDNKLGSNTCCEAKLVWSAASGTGATPRACQTFTSTGSGPNYIPAGLYPAAISNNTSPGTDYYLIVADVTYAYTPSFGFVPFSWGQPANGGNGYTITMTTYMTPRGSSTIPVQWTPDGVTIAAGQRANCFPNIP